MISALALTVLSVVPPQDASSLRLGWASTPTALRAASFSTDGRYLALSAVAGVQVFDLADLNEPLQGPLAALYPANVVWDGKGFTATSFFKKLFTIPLELGQEEKSIDWYGVHRGNVTSSRYAIESMDTGNRLHVYLQDVLYTHPKTHFYRDYASGYQLHVAEGPKHMLVGFGPKEADLEWGRVKPGTNDNEKGWKPIKKFRSFPPFSLDESGDFLASRDDIYDLRRKAAVSLGQGSNYAFSPDGKTLLYWTESKAVFFDLKKKKGIAAVSMPFATRPGLFQPSLDGSYVVTSDDEGGPDANPMANPRARQAWIVHRDGRTVPLKSIESHTAYNAFVIRYLLNKDAVDSYLANEAAAAALAANPPAATGIGDGEPATYPASDESFEEKMEAELAKLGYSEIDSAQTDDTVGRNFRTLETRPFYPQANSEYYVQAYGNLSRSKTKVIFFNLHTYVEGKGSWNLFETHSWDKRVHGSLAETGGAFNTTLVAGAIGIERKQMKFGVTTDGSIPAKIVVYRRPSKR